MGGEEGPKTSEDSGRRVRRFGSACPHISGETEATLETERGELATHGWRIQRAGRRPKETAQIAGVLQKRNRWRRAALSSMSGMKT